MYDYVVLNMHRLSFSVIYDDTIQSCIDNMSNSRRMEKLRAKCLHILALHNGLNQNNFRKPPVNAEFLEFVIKPRSANHSWRPSSKAAPK